LLGGQEFSCGNIRNLETHRPVAPIASQRGAPPRPSTTEPRMDQVSAQTDGGFTVTNSRNGFSKTYKPGI
jgi:hypothetical protein